MSEGSGRLCGRIRKATGGFYYVTAPGGEVECRARGLFRREGLAPFVGDWAEIEINDDGVGGTIVEIHERKNSLIRPPLANLDYMVAVLSVSDPAPNLAVTDKFLAVLEYKEIEPVIAVAKTDLDDGRALAALYRQAGFSVFLVSSETGEGVAALEEKLKDRVSAFSGNSGVGKSSLLNAIDPALSLQVGDTSKKLGRGRHTTRHVEMFPLPKGGYVVDTPGFSSLELMQMTDLTKEDLAGCFRDFAPFAGKCKFGDCAHLAEKSCAVLAAVERGEIARSRHQSYRLMVDEVKDRKEWQMKKEK